MQRIVTFTPSEAEGQSIYIFQLYSEVCPDDEGLRTEFIVFTPEGQNFHIAANFDGKNNIL